MKRVLVVFGEPLLGAGVESILSQDLDLEVKTTTLLSYEFLNEEIDQFQPDVVILDDDLKIPSTPKLMRILNGFPGVRLLLVNMRDNRLYVYNKQEIVIAHPTDLLATIRGT